MSKKDTLAIKDAIRLQYFPKYPRVRIIGKTGEDDIVRECFNKYGIKPDSLMVTIPIDDDKDDNADDLYNMNDDGSHKTVQVSIDQMSDINHIEKWIEFLNKTIDETPDNEMMYSFITTPIQFVLILKILQYYLLKL
jgi:hypothetical protein